MSNNIQLEAGTYEIIRNRLLKQGEDLRQRLDQLNDARKMVFGAIETQLIANARISTNNFCIARDVFAIGVGNISALPFRHGTWSKGSK